MPRQFTITLSIIFLIGCFNILLVAAQPTLFNHLTVEDGLSQNSVMSIVQDKRGMMWYGTRYGLNKYDARKFKAYHNENNLGLSDDYIVSLFCDSQDNLWAGTLNGLNRYNKQRDIFEQVPIYLKFASGGNKSISCIFEDSKGHLWVGVNKSLVLLTNKTANQFALIQSFTDRSVLCILEDHEGTIWIGTSKGLLKVEGKFPNFHLTENNMSQQPPQDYINSMVEDSDHTLWIGTFGNGLKHFNPVTNVAENFIHIENNPQSIINNNVRKLMFDRNGKLWIGTQEGLSVKNAANQFNNFVHDAEKNKTSLSQNSIYSLYEDVQGTIWIGTFFGGINSFDTYSTPFKTYQSGGQKIALSNNVVSSIIEDSLHNLWIGTEGGGLNYMNRQTAVVTYFQHKANDPESISSNLVKVVYKDRDNNIWAGTHGGGLNLYNPSKDNFTKFFYKDKDAVTLTSEITSISEDADARFWVGTQKGLMAFKRQGKILVPDSKGQDMVKVLDKSMVQYLFLDSKQKLWIGTDAALYVLQANELKLVSSPFSQKNASFKVNCITEDGSKNIWVGTYHNGLYKYSIDGLFQQSFTQKAGLPDNNILGVLEDGKHSLWISTGNGFCKYDASHGQFMNYFTIDGLAGNVFNNNAFFKNQSGEMFFGGYNGLTSFVPQEIKQNSMVPPIVLSSLNVLNQSITVGDKASLLPQDISLTKSIELKYDQNVFGIEFSVLNYVKSNKNKYAYQLQGIDKEWNYINNPSISFTNLPPGNYTLLMKGSNNDGIWSQPLALDIKILPPFWKTWKAYAVYTLLLAALIFLIVRFFFLREWVKKNNELTQLKLNFFTNISHEIRTHLSLIIGPAENLIVNSGSLHDPQQLHVIKNNSESLLQLVNELMDFRRAETGNLKLSVSNWDVVAFIHQIHATFHDLSINRNIITNLTSTNEKLELWFDKEQLEKVFFNLLSNAYKFTGNGGQINIHIEEKKNSIEIRITDNGKGISKDNLEKLFENYFQEEQHGTQNIGYGIGLALSKSIVEIHKGNIAVQSEPADKNKEGHTTFTVTLQKGREHFDNSLFDEEAKHKQLSALQIKTSETIIVTPPTSVQSGETKHTILLVEDNAEIRNFITSSLNDQYNFIECENGLQGWNVATEMIPDLIISDVMMPEMDGIAFCSKIKTDQRTSHIPVILLTAKSTTSNQLTGLQTGADIYLTKPFSLQILALHIYNIIAARERLWLQFKKTIALPKLVSEESLALPTADAQAIHPIDAAFLEEVIKNVEENMYEPNFNIAILSSKVAMSQPVLFKKIKAITGLSTNDFVKSLRLKKAAELLLQKRHTVYEISYMVGYEDSKYFSKEFKKYFGKLPSVYGEK